MPIDDRRVPEEFLLPLAIKYKLELKSDPDMWEEYEYDRMISELPVEWRTMPVQNVRVQCIAFRKADKLPLTSKRKVGGPGKKEAPPEWYLEYLKSEWWKAFRLKVLDWWEGRCAWCNSDERVDVHHRTYERLGHENMNDCVALCRECHNIADRQRKREEKRSRSICMFQ